MAHTRIGYGTYSHFTFQKKDLRKRDTVKTRSIFSNMFNRKKAWQAERGRRLPCLQVAQMADISSSTEKRKVSFGT